MEPVQTSSPGGPRSALGPSLGLNAALAFFFHVCVHLPQCALLQGRLALPFPGCESDLTSP